MMLAASCLLFAADPADVLTGGSGWTGAGLLGLVLAWLLLKHLPAKDQQAKDLADANAATVKGLLDRHDQQVSVEREVHRAELAAAQGTFERALAQVVTHCKEEAAERDALFREEFAKLTAVVNKMLEATETRAKRSQ